MTPTVAEPRPPQEHAGDAWLARSQEHPRVCPSCELMPAAPGDRYCTGCGSAADRSAWVSR